MNLTPGVSFEFVNFLFLPVSASAERFVMLVHDGGGLTFATKTLKLSDVSAKRGNILMVFGNYKT